MNHPVDRIFKRKLEGFEISPSENAWEKLQKHNKVKKISSFKYRIGIAASLLILMSGAYFVLDMSSATPENILSENRNENKGRVDNIAPPVPDLPVTLQEENVQQNIPKRSEKSNAVVNSGNFVKAATKVSEPVGVKKQKVEQVAATTLEMPKPVNKMDVAANVKPAVPEVQVLSVSVGTVTSENPDAETSKDTLFDRIANTAREINDEGVLSEIRQFKDEVVSLEFFKTRKSSI